MISFRKISDNYSSTTIKNRMRLSELKKHKEKSECDAKIEKNNWIEYENESVTIV